MSKGVLTLGDPYHDPAHLTPKVRSDLVVVSCTYSVWSLTLPDTLELWHDIDDVTVCCSETVKKISLIFFYIDIDIFDIFYMQCLLNQIIFYKLSSSLCRGQHSLSFLFRPSPPLTPEWFSSGTKKADCWCLLWAAATSVIQRGEWIRFCLQEDRRRLF